MLGDDIQSAWRKLMINIIKVAEEDWEGGEPFRMEEDRQNPGLQRT